MLSRLNGRPLVRKYLPVTVGAAVMLLADPVMALDLKPLEASSIKAASDYVAAPAPPNQSERA